MVELVDKDMKTVGIFLKSQTDQVWSPLTLSLGPIPILQKILLTAHTSMQTYFYPFYTPIRENT